MVLKVNITGILLHMAFQPCLLYLYSYIAQLILIKFGKEIHGEQKQNNKKTSVEADNI